MQDHRVSLKQKEILRFAKWKTMVPAVMMIGT